MNERPGKVPPVFVMPSMAESGMEPAHPSEIGDGDKGLQDVGIGVWWVQYHWGVGDVR
jgi:hypothetical protein